LDNDGEKSIWNFHDAAKTNLAEDTKIYKFHIGRFYIEVMQRPVTTEEQRGFSWCRSLSVSSETQRDRVDFAQ
jgi:hypothetical protein